MHLIFKFIFQQILSKKHVTIQNTILQSEFHLQPYQQRTLTMTCRSTHKEHHREHLKTYLPKNSASPWGRGFMCDAWLFNLKVLFLREVYFVNFFYFFSHRQRSSTIKKCTISTDLSRTAWQVPVQVKS